jgi:hypothetical protein
MHKFHEAFLDDPLMTKEIEQLQRKEKYRPSQLKYGFSKKLTRRLEIMIDLIK